MPVVTSWLENGELLGIFRPVDNFLGVFLVDNFPGVIPAENSVVSRLFTTDGNPGRYFLVGYW